MNNTTIRKISDRIGIPDKVLGDLITSGQVKGGLYENNCSSVHSWICPYELREFLNKKKRNDPITDVWYDSAIKNINEIISENNGGLLNNKTSVILLSICITLMIVIFYQLTIIKTHGM